MEAFDYKEQRAWRPLLWRLVGVNFPPVLSHQPPEEIEKMSSIVVHNRVFKHATIETGEVDAGAPVMKPVKITFAEGAESDALSIGQGGAVIEMDAEAADAFFNTLRDMMGKN